MFVDWEVPLSHLRVSVRSLLFVVQVWSTEGEAQPGRRGLGFADLLVDIQSGKQKSLQVFQKWW